MHIIDFDKGKGLVPVVVQDSSSGKVLMLAYMNQPAWQTTLKTGKACYFSRSRHRLWVKGEESGHCQEVEEILLDCDADTILLKVRQHGAACHKGYRTCFYRKRDKSKWKIVEKKIFNPRQVYRRDG